jgi:hypothetical protein
MSRDCLPNTGCLLPILLLLALAAPAYTQQDELSKDPLQRCAQKALRGDYKLKPWQTAAYQWYVQHGAVKRHVWLTQYGPWEGYHGAPYHIAANPQHLPMGSVVWLSKPGALRVVTNRGADYNDPIARHNGCAHWVDLWTRYRGEYGLDTTTADCYVIRLGARYRAGYAAGELGGDGR